MSAQIQDMNAANLREKEYFRYGHEWGKGDNWLALGNSLTLIDAYGHGICSTQADNDYFGLVKKYLERKYPEVEAFRYNYVAWEKETDNRSFKLYHIDSFLSPELDLVTIQLGENVFDMTTYQEDLAVLIRHIQGTCPKAKIVLIDDFWSNRKSEMRKAAAEETGIAFADLSEIRGKEEYQSKEGTVFYEADGTENTVSKEAETHPGDAGMKYIAEKVIEELER